MAKAFQVMSLVIWMGLALVLDSLEVAAQVMSAKNFGANDSRLLKLTNKTLIKYSVILGATLMVGLLIFFIGLAPICLLMILRYMN